MYPPEGESDVEFVGREELHLALDAWLAFTYFAYLLKALVVHVNYEEHAE